MNIDQTENLLDFSLAPDSAAEPIAPDLPEEATTDTWNDLIQTLREPANNPATAPEAEPAEAEQAPPPMIDVAVSLVQTADAAEANQTPDLLIFDIPSAVAPERSIADHIAEMQLALDASITPSQHVEPEHSYTAELWNRDATGSHYVGTLYFDTNTGKEYKIVVDQQEVWL